jgi:uncharacterized iron-regulated membrane protein
MNDNRTVRIVIGCIAVLCIAACAATLWWPKEHHANIHKAPVIKHKHHEAHSVQKSLS